MTVTGGMFVMSMVLILTLSALVLSGKEIPAEFMGVVSTIIAFWFGTQVPKETIEDDDDNVEIIGVDVSDKRKEVEEIKGMIESLQK